MNLITYLYRQSWSLLLLSAFASIVAGLSGAALVAVIGKGVNAVNESAPLVRLAWAFFALVLLHLVTKTLGDVALLRLTQRAVCDLRIALAHRLLATSQPRLQELGKPALLANMTTDVDTFARAFQWLPLAFANVIVIGSCLAYMAWLSWQLFLLLLVFLGLGMVGFHFAERQPLSLLEQVRDQMDRLYQHFRDLIEGSRELQLNRRRRHMFIHQVLGREADGYRQTLTSSLKTYVWLINVGSILFFAVMGLLLFVVPQWLPQSAAVLSTVTLLLLYLIRPISELMVALPIVRQAGVALMRLQRLESDLLDSGSPRTEEMEQRSLPQAFARATGWQLELKGLRHHYPSSTDDRQFVLGPLDVAIHQGEILYVVGGNGSGKTTLAMLLLGLFPPDEGQIVLDGVPVTEANVADYRQHFTAVFADFHLFAELLDAHSDELDERARHYLQALGMAHKVRVKAGRFTTTGLSTGQKKRLALVTAYLEDRPIYLFDEWAADQDPSFKKVFYTELLPELKAAGKTVIVITHDDAYFGCADRILKLADGHAAHAPLAA